MIRMIKCKDSYKIKNSDGKTISSINYYDFDIPDFRYILVSDVFTDTSYRKKGLASSLINALYNDIRQKNENNCLYVFVDENNYNAIKLYNKLKFKYVKKYELKNKNYIIMAKGNWEIGVFDKYSFC